MSRISTKLNLAALKNAVIIKHGKNKDVDCVLIPIEQNKLFRSEKGAVYLDLIGFDFNNTKENSKDTHLVKQSFSKEYLDTLSEDEKKSLPILGNHIVWNGASSGSGEAASPTVLSDDDLPF